MYTAFEDAALRLKAGIHDLKTSYESEEVKAVLQRVEEREEGSGNDGFLGESTGETGWDLVVGKPRWTNEDSVDKYQKKHSP